MTIENHHRTALIMYAGGDNPKYQERGDRLLKTVGGDGHHNPGIKVDCFTVYNEGEVLNVYRGTPYQIPHPSNYIGTLNEFNAELSVSQYDQVLHSHSRHSVVTAVASTVGAAFFDDETLAKTSKAEAEYHAAKAAATAAFEADKFDPADHQWDENEEDEEF